MATHALPEHFSRFFAQLNPNPSFEQTASREHQAITALIENRFGPAGALEPRSFLQGSYRQDTAIYTINDVDIVALCKLWYPPAPGSGSTGWTRDQIFEAVAQAIRADSRFADKVRYGPTSMVIHVDSPIKLEVLPGVYKSGTSNPQAEPFVLFRPERRHWEDGYAREHQRLLSLKNSALLAGGNFKPVIKVLKHLRSHWRAEGVSFHLECLLHSIQPSVFLGGPADYITNTLTAIASTPAETWYQQYLMTPCGERDIFTAAEWTHDSWVAFHTWAGKWLSAAAYAQTTTNKSEAIEAWRLLLGEDYFPRTVT